MIHSKIPGHFEEQFQDTYGHPIRPGNLEKELQTTLKEA